MQLRYYQEEAIQATLDYFMQGNTGNPTVVIPTGCGKSLVIAESIRRFMAMFPGQRFMSLTHVQELIQNNSETLKDIWPDAPMGIFSAGLKSKDTRQDIIYGGIQSVANCAEVFGHRDLVFIDECFSADTEILTENGFVRFDKLQDEQVAQLDIADGMVTFTMPLRKIKQPPSSKVVAVKSDKTFDMMVTENHIMNVVGLSGKFEKRKVKDVTKANYAKIPVAGYGAGAEQKLTTFEKLVIMFQADGHDHRKNADGTAIISFVFSKERKKKAFKELMAEGNFSWKKLDERPAVGNVKARSRYMVYIDFPINKRVYSYFELKNLHFTKAQEIIEFMNIWDGNVASKSTYLYTNTDKRAADFYAAVAALAGYRTNMVKVIDERSDNFSDCYRLFITKRNMVTTQSFDIKDSDYKGDVYCVEVPTGNIIVRRGGKTIVTGNCHLVSPNDDTRYQFVLAKLKEINPSLKVIGYTATDYRLGQGRITDSGLFTDVCYNAGSLESFNRLIDEGFLSPIVARPTNVKLDTSGIHISNGDFVQSEVTAAVDDQHLLEPALRETVGWFKHENRRSGLVFVNSVKHVDEAAAILNAMGMPTVAVHSKMKPKERTANIEKWLLNEVAFAVNQNVLTVGINNPFLDLIADIQATVSTGKHVQKWGRGTRPFDWHKLSPKQQAKYMALAGHVKVNCRGLDFCGNVPRLGPINDPVIPKRKGDKGGVAPIKICETGKLVDGEGCGAYNHASARYCDECGGEFRIQPKVYDTAGTDEIIRSAREVEPSTAPQIETFAVDNVFYSRQEVKGGKAMLKATYQCGLRSFTELKGFEHGGYAGKLARDWWRQRASSEPPTTIDYALLLNAQLAKPKTIDVNVIPKYPEIVSYGW